MAEREWTRESEVRVLTLLKKKKYDSTQNRLLIVGVR